MTRRALVVALAGLALVAALLTLSPVRRAGACNDGRDAPACTATLFSTTTVALVDRVIEPSAPSPMLATPTPLVDVRTEAAPAAPPIETLPRFAG